MAKKACGISSITKVANARSRLPYTEVYVFKYFTIKTFNKFLFFNMSYITLLENRTNAAWSASLRSNRLSYCGSLVRYDKYICRIYWNMKMLVYIWHTSLIISQLQHSVRACADRFLKTINLQFWQRYTMNASCSCCRCTVIIILSNIKNIYK